MTSKQSTGFLVALLMFTLYCTRVNAAASNKYFWIEPACENCPGFMVAEVNSDVNATLCADGSTSNSCYVSRIMDGSSEVKLKERGIVQGNIDLDYNRAVFKLVRGQIFKSVISEEASSRNLKHPQVFRLGFSGFQRSYIRFRLNAPGDVSVFENFHAVLDDSKVGSASKRLLSTNQHLKIQDALKSKELLVIGVEQKSKVFEATEFFVKMS
jgi:hypothetical protein